MKIEKRIKRKREFPKKGSTSVSLCFAIENSHDSTIRHDFSRIATLQRVFLSLDNGTGSILRFEIVCPVAVSSEGRRPHPPLDRASLMGGPMNHGICRWIKSHRARFQFVGASSNTRTTTARRSCTGGPSFTRRSKVPVIVRWILHAATPLPTPSPFTSRSSPRCFLGRVAPFSFFV